MKKMPSKKERPWGTGSFQGTFHLSGALTSAGKGGQQASHEGSRGRGSEAIKFGGDYRNNFFKLTIFESEMDRIQVTVISASGNLKNSTRKKELVEGRGTWRKGQSSQLSSGMGLRKQRSKAHTTSGLG